MVSLGVAGGLIDGEYAMLQVVRMVTSPDGISKLGAKLGNSSGGPDSFEALLTVTGFKQTDLTADVIAVNALLLIKLPPQSSSHDAPPFKR